MANKEEKDVQDMDEWQKAGYFAARATGKALIKGVSLFGKGVGAVGKSAKKIGGQVSSMTKGVISGVKDEIIAEKDAEDDTDE
ncbi:MAG TPA: hypothetical protein DCO72_00600 [Ruminococcus sp.]|nr:hypothetical protein [Ruminococcus sp.]